MEITSLLAQIWGISLLAIGIGFFSSKQYYRKIYRELEKQAFATFTFAMAAIAAGIAQIHAHNIWDTFPHAVISLLGWGLLFKGVLFAIAPRFADRSAEWEAKRNFTPFVGTLMIILGVYLIWVGL